jgi:hypothetical protein
MKILTCQEYGFPTMWSRLWDRQRSQSPLHTKLAHDYYRQRPTDEGAMIVDHSFLVVDGEKAVAGMRAATVLSEGKLALSAYEIPLYVLEDPDVFDRRNYRLHFIQHFGKILPDRRGLIIYLDPLEDGQISFFTNFLLLNGGTCSPKFHQVLDLTVSEEELWQGIRRSYRSLINWGKRNLEIDILNNSSQIEAAMEGFRVLHKEVSGRETRTSASWQRQVDMIRAGEAFAVLAQLDGRLVSAGFFMYTRKSCYYGSSASKRELFDKPLSHSVIWTAILHARSLGCATFEMGERIYPCQGTSSQKELKISFFKAGFGGATRNALYIQCEGKTE